MQFPDAHNDAVRLAEIYSIATSRLSPQELQAWHRVEDEFGKIEKGRFPGFTSYTEEEEAVMKEEAGRRVPGGLAAARKWVSMVEQLDGKPFIGVAQ